MRRLSCSQTQWQNVHKNRPRKWIASWLSVKTNTMRLRLRGRAVDQSLQYWAAFRMPIKDRVELRKLHQVACLVAYPQTRRQETVCHLPLLFRWEKVWRRFPLSTRSFFFFFCKTSRHPCGDHTVSHQSTTPLNFFLLGERAQKSVYVYSENSKELSVNLIETHLISRGFRLKRSSNNTVILSRCHMSLLTALY
jgi:hypothetical protein